MVSIIMGSESDRQTMERAGEALARFGVEFEVNVISAHRAHRRLAAFVEGAEARGVKVFIAGAGMAAHLAGVVAALTVSPVIGVPLLSKSTGGLDALLSMAQMPRGVPVATVAIDGAANAGILAAQILAVGDPALRQKIREFKSELEG
ncbi:N5-carboxyaminoimidazole ribonucleotide mutase [Clostridia bacterium]|nr:N5-carboxyaminoimidazole ribonucleotide mutase [Clostridia bacterium]